MESKGRLKILRFPCQKVWNQKVDKKYSDFHASLHRLMTINYLPVNHVKTLLLEKKHGTRQPFRNALKIVSIKVSYVKPLVF